MLRERHRGHIPSTRQRGVAILELAIILPILLLLALGAVEFALALSQYKTVVNQVRVASRYLSGNAPGMGHAEAACLVRNGQLGIGPACTGSALLPALANVTITIQDASNSPATHRAQYTATGNGDTAVNLVTVTVQNYRYVPSVGGFLSGMLGDNPAVTFRPISSTMRQVL